MTTPDLQELDRRARIQIQKQLEASQKVLIDLVKNGLEPSDVLHLDFSFVAPDRAHAEALRAHLEKNHCLDVAVDLIDEVADDRSDSIASQRHVVSGRSHPTKLSAQVVGQWVPWMVVQGVKHGCEFDGWTADVPPRG